MTKEELEQGIAAIFEESGIAQAAREHKLAEQLQTTMLRLADYMQQHQPSPWISVEERLPEERGTYFMLYNENFWFVDIGYYEPQRGWSNCPNNKPTHWMPIPPIEKGE